MYQNEIRQTDKDHGPGSLKQGPAQVLRWGLRIAYLFYLAFCFLFRPRHRGAGVALWYGGRVLVIKNSYRRFYGVPAGGLRRKESPRDAASRELGEETGIFIDAGRLRPAGIYEDTSEFARDRFSLFEVFLDRQPEVTVDNTEVVWAGFLPPARALTLDLMPPIETYLRTKT